MQVSIIFITLMILGTFFLGLFDVKQRTYLLEGIDPQVLLTITWLGTSIIAFIGVLFTGMPNVTSEFFLASAGSISLNVISQNLFVRAFSLEEASLIGPLRLLVPVFVIGTGFLFLHEQPSGAGILGIFVTVIGLGVLLYWGQGASKRFSLSKGVMFGLLGSLLFGISFPLDKIAVTHSSALLSTATTFGGVALLTALINIINQKDFIEKIKITLQLRSRPLMYLSLLLGIGNILTFQALNYSLVAYASSLKRLQALWTVVLARTFLKEEKILIRLAAAGIMIAGIIISVVAK